MQNLVEGVSPRSWRKAFGLAVCLSASAVMAQEVDLEQLSLKRLMDIDVTSVSKRSERLMGVATSIYVITEEDIRRSGATRIQDVLKMAPGAWFVDDSYTITSQAVREAVHPFRQTLLWILDGVPINNPLSGGMIFDVLDLPLADIERIEVIKGPGGTIYGANAASGIISIFTKDGQASYGPHASLEVGSQEYLAPYLRYGFEPWERFFITAWGKLKHHRGYDRNPLFSGDSLWGPLKGGGRLRVANQFHPAPDDNQEAISVGGKWDFQPVAPWRWSGGISWSDVRSGKYLIVHTPWPDSAPANPAAYRHPAPQQKPDEDRRDQIIARSRLDLELGEAHSLFVQAYHWHHEFRWLAGSGIYNNFDITDLEIQDNLTLFRSHRLNMGANLRRVEYRNLGLDGNPSPIFTHTGETAWLLGAFIQDEMTLGERWRLTAGAKAEFWTLIGPEPEISPSLRLAYQAGQDLTFWAAASRSVTTPSYSQTGMEFRSQQIPSAWFFEANGLPAPPAAGKWAAVIPGSVVKPGEFYTLEAGNRGILGSLLQWDVSGFYSWAQDQVDITQIDEKRALVVPSTSVPGDSIFPLFNSNITDYESFGGEAVARVYPREFLHLELSYALFVKYALRGLKIPGDPLGRTHDVSDYEDNIATPRHIGRVKAYIDLPYYLELTLHGTVASEFHRGAPFNYRTQTTDFLNGVVPAESNPIFQLEGSLRRSFYYDRITAMVWGRNLLAREPFVENYYPFVWSTYPHQVHRTFGAGIEYRY